MRGEVCVGAASVLSAASLIMLIFLHVGQISTSTVPRGIYMARVNTSGYGDALASATQDPIQGLYTSNSSLELGHHLGLRDDYRFGLYSHCAYVSPARAAAAANATNSTSSSSSSSGGGICANHTTGAPYRPYSAITIDMQSNYTNLTNLILPASATRFRDEGALGSYTTGAYYLILLGTIATALAFLIGTLTRTYTFLLSTSFAVLGTTLLLIAAAMWTAMVNRSEDVNSFVINNGVQQIPLGVHVQAGPGLYLLWASFAALFASVVPYMISCCTYRG